MFLPTFDPVDASELALWTEAEFDSNGCPDPRICALAPLDGSHAGALVFLEGRRNLLVLENLTAAAVLITPDLAEKVPNGIAILRVKSPSRAFAAIARRLYPQSLGPQPVAGSGISEAAYIHPSVNVEDNVTVEAGAVIGPNVSIGSGTLIGPNTVIAKSCQIGRNCQIASHVSIRNALIGDRVTLHDGVRVGQDGFGFVPGPEGLEKVPQIGRVIIQNDVEIGANSAIDRGALGDTVIGEGTKIDNLVQIAHNVRIGRHCAIAAHGGISGSVTIGDGVLLGGRVGLADHITVGSGAQIAASSGVMNDVPPGEKWGGAPAKPIKLLFREFATLKALAAGKKKDTKDG